MNTISIATISTTAEDGWEPFVHDGHSVGEVRWIAQEARPQGPLAVGMWRIDPEAGAELPYAVAEGEAELEQADGTTIALTPGVIVTLPDGFTATWRTRSPFKKLFVVA
jgi:uncharacterized cupin superfamily protein